MNVPEKSIAWIEISLSPYGGFMYNEQARKALSRIGRVDLVNAQARHQRFRVLKFLESFLRLTKLEGRRDAWVRTFYSALSLPFDKTRGKQIVVRHHVDFSTFPWYVRPFFWVLELWFERVLRRMDALVVVSQYWKQYFLRKGYSNVHVIYNGFDLKDFDISDEEVASFKEKYGLTKKPIVYLGNCQAAKGVKEAYEALRGLDAHFVTSGRPVVRLAARNLELEYRDYLKLLKASDIVLAMSKFQEGWCRTVHEAMLLKRPVIGSGKGGMRELLEGGGQMICEHWKNLPNKVEYLLSHPQERAGMGERGYLFAKDFTQERFEEEWILFMNTLL